MEEGDRRERGGMEEREREAEKGRDTCRHACHSYVPLYLHRMSPYGVLCRCG